MFFSLKIEIYVDSRAECKLASFEIISSCDRPFGTKGERHFFDEIQSFLIALHRSFAKHTLLHFWGVIYSSVIFPSKYSLKPVAMRLLTVNLSFIDLPFPTRQRVNFAKLPIAYSSYCSFWRIYRSVCWTNYVKKILRCAWCTFIRIIYVGCVIWAFV